MTGRAERDPGIDLLRGLSILLVVVHHVALRISLKKSLLGAVLPHRLLDALAWNGYEAVFIFFVVSGFLITRNSLARWGGLAALDVRAFYARRAARILPCLLALIAVLCLFHWAGVREFVIRRPDQSLGRAVLAALGLHLNWYEGVTSWLPGNWDVLWSLSIEEVFYLGFPLLGLVLRRFWPMAVVLALFALSLPLSRAALDGQPIWQEKAYLPGMAAIATGVLGALAAQRWPLPWNRAAALLALAGATGLTAVLAFGAPLWRALGNGSMLVLTGSALALVLASDARHRAGRPLRLPGLGWLAQAGRHSYEIYLTHMFVVWPVVRAFRASGLDPRWGFLPHLAAVLLAWGLGWAVARLFSEPADRWLRGKLLSSPRP